MQRCQQMTRTKEGIFPGRRPKRARVRYGCRRPRSSGGWGRGRPRRPSAPTARQRSVSCRKASTSYLMRSPHTECHTRDVSKLKPHTES
ncbi:hypothetical protein TNIN_14981 [Trichonephila inaurata madagascariensis]|uniref:Uncharacterized protein n=1 Tax=Trichonephila inaurata madagascariensis TaxID=2747483 RepID=A0A8X7BSN3_9ARAC|nr:hypothetical protein TNIN_14981 [Trichonephila inaurata madagascariensis]